MKLKPVLVLAIVLAANIATAAPRAFEQEGQWACAGEDAARADKALNVAYRQAVARLDAGGRINLRNDQRTWIKHRDKQCSANIINQGQILGCEQDLTITRIAEIERL